MLIRIKERPFCISIVLVTGLILLGGWQEGQKMRTVQATPEKVSHGKTLFAACGSCHGAEGEGRVGMGPRLNSRSFLAAASDQFLLDTIKLGREGTTMIPWGGAFSDSDIESMVAYLRSLNPVPPVVLDESPIKGSDFHGKAVWQSICAACHGNQGGGYMETANGTGIGRKAFLDAASNGYLRYIIRNGKDLTMMRGFTKGPRSSVADLSTQEIEDVIAYLRKNAW